MTNPLRYAHILGRMIDTPLLVHPAKAQIVLDVMMSRLRGTTPDTVILAPDQEANVSLFEDRRREQERDGYDLIHGTAVVSVRGTLVHRHGTFDALSGMIAYDTLCANVRAALDDDEVKGIFLLIDSPGGEVPGAFDAVDCLYGYRGEKPIWACVDETACSAGYAIASAADRIIVTRTGLVGSIGVVCMHLDISAALQDIGIKPTFIQYGARKTDGASEFPLSAEARESIQKNVDAVGEIFVATVARNRGLKPKDVKNQQAAVYQGVDAVEEGLVDAVMSAEECFTAFHKFVFEDDAKGASEKE